MMTTDGVIEHPARKIAVDRLYEISMEISALRDQINNLRLEIATRQDEGDELLARILAQPTCPPIDAEDFVLLVRNIRTGAERP
jgi:hypothetical protein